MAVMLKHNLRDFSIMPQTLRRAVMLKHNLQGRRDLPLVSIEHLDHLWFQVGGTLCNLTCGHCFISCSPTNRAFGFLSLAEVRRRLVESVPLGVKEYYFTGGEPFLNPEMTDILIE